MNDIAWVNLPVASLSKEGIVQAQVHESEMRRCVGFWSGHGTGSAQPRPVSITVTNQRLLLQSITASDGDSSYWRK